MTVINVMEFNSLSKKTTEFINSLDKIFDYMIDDIQLLGIGTASRNNNTTYYIVCRSEKLQSIRKRYNLPEQDFHITLGFKHKDVFGVRKNVVMDEKSEFINVLTQEYMNKENFNFIKNIDNYEEDTNLDILPVSINDTFLKIKVGDYLLDVGLLDPQNKLWIFTKYKDSAGVSTMSTTEILRILKK